MNPSTSRGVSRQLAYMANLANGGRVASASYVNAIAHLWLVDIIAGDQYRARVLGESNRPWRPAQALLAAILEGAINDLEYGDQNAIDWVTGRWDDELVAENKFTLSDVLTYLGITAPLEMVRKELTARFATKMGHRTAAFRRSHHQPRQIRQIFHGFDRERWRIKRRGH